ncbi:redoxin domain-containing protein [bacterium]|nr:redoxin domain-containing protein [bacterium]
MSQDYSPTPEWPEEESSKPLPFMTWVVGGLIVLAIALIAGTMLGSSLKGQPAPDFVGRNTNGDIIRLSDYRGKVVVLDFWATWCPPCVANVPTMKAFQEAHYEKGVEVIGISADMNVNVLADFEQTQMLNYPTVFEGAREIIDQYGVRAFPTLVVIDREGKVRRIGHHLDLDEAVRPLL